MELAVSLTLCGVLLRVESLKAFFHAGIVDAQELVLCSGHVNEIRLALSAFLIEKLVHWLVLWSFSQICTDNLVQRFPQVRRAALGCWSAFCVMFARLVYGRINTGEAHDRTAAGKTAYIADLSHELRGRCLANTVHGTHSIVLRQLLCKPRHLGAQSRQCHLTRKKLLCRCGNEQSCVVILRQRSEMAATAGIEIQRFLCAEMVALALAPLLYICK